MAINDSIGYIDLNKKLQKAKISLHLPNKVKIGILSEAYNIEHSLKLGNINEISFKLPYKLDIHNRLVDNKNINKIRLRYLLKVTKGLFSEWYLITKEKDSMDNDKDVKEIEAYSLGYELNDKLITYSQISVNAKQALIDALSQTIWGIGYIDAEFELLYRSFDVQSKSVLEFIIEIAETFNALILWDTENRLINLYQPNNIGIDRGLKFSYGHYLKTLNKENDSDEMVTRLIVYGKDGLSIQRVNPTATNYIEDFSFFMYPFQRDEERNVISHSYYMSDELCNAIIDYNDLLLSKKGEFNTLLTEKENKETVLTNLNNELKLLEIDMDIILDNLYVAQTTLQPYDYILSQKNLKQIEINNKNAEIDTLQDEIDAVVFQINNLKNLLSIESNFTSNQIIERNQFIISREWKDENYVDDKKLYEAAIDVFNEMKQPKTIIEIDIVNFLEIVSEQRNWNKLNLGDIITIIYEKMNIAVKAKIIEINFNYETGNVKLTIANIKEILSNEDKLIKLLYKSLTTSTVLDMNKYKWDGYQEDLGEVFNVINRMFDYAKNQINMAVNETVVIDRRGITIYDPNDPLAFLRATHGVLGITNDGGNTFKHAITSIGIVGERIYGRIITAERVTIGDPDGIFEIRGNKGVITDRSGREVMWLGLFNDNPERFGLKLENDISQVIVDRDAGFLINRYEDFEWVEVASLNAEGYLHITGLKIDYMDGILTNGIIINPEDGIKITRSDNLVETILNATDGITIQRNNGVTWDKKFYVDVNGYLWAEDIKSKRLTIINSNEEILLDAESLNFDFTTLSSIIMDDVIISSEKLVLYNQWISIQQTYITLLSQINRYIDVVYNDRDYTYPGLNTAKDNLDSAKINLQSKYNNLELAITPVFIDMNITTHIKNDLGYTDDETYTAREKFYNKFKEYHDAATTARDKLEDFLEKSSLQLGRNYNNVVIDAINGIVVTADVGNATIATTLNATDGIKIERDGVKKFYVDIDGVLWAEDLYAKRLILYNSENKLVLDANSKFLDLNQFDEILGNIQAENISTTIITADSGFINNLTVNHLKTLGMDAYGTTRNYIDIKDNSAKWITGEATGGSVQATNSNGELLYWTDSSHTSTTIYNTGLPVMVEDYEETIKMEIYFEGQDPTHYPIIKMGAGVGVGDNGIAFIYKSDGFYIDYKSSTGNLRNYFADEYGMGFKIQDKNQVKIKVNEIEHIIATKIVGSSNFGSTSGSFISFGKDLGTTDYAVIITPTANPDGYIGEIWVGNITATGCTIYNSGSATTTFKYVVVY